MISQIQVLNKILETKDFSMVTMNNLNEDYFFNYKAEFNFIKNHYDQYHNIPDILTFQGVFPDFDIETVTESDNYLLNQLYNDYNTSYLITKFNGMKGLIEKGDTDGAMDFFTKAVVGLRQGGAVSCTDLIQDTSRFDRYLDRMANSSKAYISTGLPELDNIIGGIDRENENMVIAARTGIGKSWLLIKIAVAAVTQGLNVGFYSGEMSKDKVGYRMDTLLGNIKNSAITRGEPNDAVRKTYQSYINNLPNVITGKFNVFTPTDIAGPATVPALQALVEKYHFDILLVDQYSLLEDTSRSTVMHERVANISKALKNLQVMKQIPIVAVTQMNRTKAEDEKGNKVQDPTQIALSDRIGQDATTILMLSRVEDEDEEMHKLKIEIVKARDGGDGRHITYNVDFNTGRFDPILEGATKEEAQELEDSYEPF